MISAVSWPSGPTSEEIKSGKWIASLPNPPCPAPQTHLHLVSSLLNPQEAHEAEPLQSDSVDYWGALR